MPALILGKISIRELHVDRRLDLVVPVALNFDDQSQPLLRPRIKDVHVYIRALARSPASS